MPKISVIVPVYRVEKYLERCVESVINQTFSDFELILVNDGSPDTCPRLCDEWAAKDSRIRVIHKENGGLSDARNAGFAGSTGEWITFIDSDDYIHPKMLEVLYAAVQEFGVPVSACGYAETHGEPLQAEDPCATVLSPADFYRNYNITATVAWGKLYHRSIVLPYPVGKLHEDEYVTYRILFALDRVIFINSPLYGYYQNTTGIIRSHWSLRRLDSLPAFRQQIAFFGQKGYPQLRQWRIREIMKNVLFQLDLVTKQDPPNPQGERTLKKWGRKILLIYWPDRVFYVDKDLWLYKQFYPRLTQLYLYGQAFWKKLFRRK